MPATSDKQKRFMDAAAHNPAFAKQAGVPVSVAKDFSEKSKGIKFGGSKTRPDLQKVNEPETRQGKSELFKKGGDTMATKGVNPFAKFEKSGKDVEKKGMKEGSKADMAMDKKQMMGMKKGGMAEGGKTDTAQDKAMIKKAFKQHDSQEHKGGKGTALKLKSGGMRKMAEGGMPMKDGKPAFIGDGKGAMKHGGMTKMAKGGGIETKGKTKGTMIKMKNGGKAC